MQKSLEKCADIAALEKFCKFKRIFICKVGFDTAENESSKYSFAKSASIQPRMSHCDGLCDPTYERWLRNRPRP